MIPKGANSGFYLRGRHEIQILDDYPNCTPAITSDGAIYNFKAADKFASKKPGEWNCVEATMKGNRVTVVLNGVTIHDNVVVDRATGSELDDKVNEPGSIFVQGNHGMVGFRNMRIKTLD
jgi:preprotein translocase subunit Sec63